MRYGCQKKHSCATATTTKHNNRQQPQAFRRQSAPTQLTTPASLANLQQGDKLSTNNNATATTHHRTTAVRKHFVYIVESLTMTRKNAIPVSEIINPVSRQKEIPIGPKTSMLLLPRPLIKLQGGRRNNQRFRFFSTKCYESPHFHFSKIN